MGEPLLASSARGCGSAANPTSPSSYRQACDGRATGLRVKAGDSRRRGGSEFLSLCGPLQVISCVICPWPALRYQRPFDPSALSEPVLRMLRTTDHT